MNDAAIAINYNLFDQKSSLCKCKNGQTSWTSVESDIPTLSTQILKECYETGINNVIINAPVDFVKELSDKIKSLEMTTYSQNKISIRGLD